VFDRVKENVGHFWFWFNTWEFCVNVLELTIFDRLQLMLYKLLWDTIVKEGFPTGPFFDYFSLNRNYVLSQDVRDHIANAGIKAQTLEEIVRYYENTFQMLPIANNQLLLK
jgi:exonuclease V